jgi:hypothetical protein
MRSGSILVFAISVILLLTIQAVVMAQVEIEGYVQADSRVFLEKDNSFYWNESRLKLAVEADPSENAHTYGEFWVRGFGIPEVDTSSDLMRREKDRVSPWSVLFREAYLDLYGFLSPDLDVRIGLQRIVWGTADKLNPTDNLNPDDLEDIWDFGRHLGSNSIKASYYLGDYTLTAVYVPIFTPAALPVPEWAGALAPPMELPIGLALRNLNNTIITPQNSLIESSMAGLKVEKNFRGYDLSLSYFYGRDDIPLVRKAQFIPVDTLGTVDVSVELIYPRIQVLGLDMAGVVGKVGVWAEGALFLPEKVDMITDLTGLGMEIHRSVALDEPYFRYVVGTDYTFKSGWYVNGQYLHGFIHERKEDDMGDYCIFGVEKKLLNDKLNIIPVSGGIEIRDFSDIENNYALIFAPGVTYSPFDNAEIDFGFQIIAGKKTTTFGRVRDNDEVYLRAEYSF